MSIATEITRLDAAKEALKISINAKGGALTTETIESYPAAVDAISAGGGDSNFTIVEDGLLPYEIFKNGIELKLGAGVTYVGNAVVAINKVTFASSLIEIGYRAFQNASGLTSLTLPIALEKIGGYAFQSCTNLSGHLEIPSSVTDMGSNSFDTTRITSIDLNHNPVFNVLNNSFRASSYAESIINFPLTLTKLDDWSLYNFGINAVNKPTLDLSAHTALTHIDTYVFYNSGFTSIIMPSSLIYIGNKGFYNCKSLASFKIEAVVPPVLGSTDCFDNMLAGGIMYVPSASLTAYQTATNWTEYASRMVGY